MMGVYTYVKIRVVKISRYGNVGKIQLKLSFRSNICSTKNDASKIMITKEREDYLYTHVINWNEYKAFMNAFFDADVIDRKGHVPVPVSTPDVSMRGRLDACSGVRPPDWPESH